MNQANDNNILPMIHKPPRTTTIANHFVGAIIAGAKQMGYDTTAILERAGIPAELLNEKKARVYPDSFARL